MAGLSGRFSTVVKAKISKLLDRAEDPGETLEYSYQKQMELLQNVKKGIADVVTAKKRLQLQSQKLEQQVVKLDTQARQALAAGNEELARTALERKNVGPDRAAVARPAGRRARGPAAVDGRQPRRSCSAKIEAFRSKKEVIKAQYSAAEAQVRISEAATGVGEEMADVGLAMQRALDKTENMRARATPSTSSRRPARSTTSRSSAAARTTSTASSHELSSGSAGRRRAGEDEGRARRPAAGSSAGELNSGDDAPGARVGGMIVRISTEGQYELADDDAERAQRARQRGRRGGRRGRRGALRRPVRADARLRSAPRARALPTTTLRGSDVILPPPDTSFDEARHEFSGEGLIPD